MKKLNDNLVIYTCIEPMGKNNGKYKLSALRFEDGTHCMPGLEITTNDGFEESTEHWDSENYLEKILQTILKFKEKAMSSEDYKFLSEFIDFIPESDFEDMQLILEKGAELGFFNKEK